jgi:hypothetical protein
LVGIKTKTMTKEQIEELRIDLENINQNAECLADVLESFNDKYKWITRQDEGQVEEQEWFSQVDERSEKVQKRLKELL